MPRLRIVAMAAVSATLAAGCSSAATNPGSTTSPSAATTTSAPVLAAPLNQLVGAAIDAFRHAQSVHLYVSSTSGGPGAYVIYADGSGIATTTATISSGTVQLNVVEVGSTVYIHGPATFWKYLETKNAHGSTTELTTTELNSLTSHWVVSPGTDDAVIPTIRSTVEGFLGLLASDKGLKSVGTATVLGTKAEGVEGSVGGLVLWMASSGTPYPIELTGLSPATLFTFTDWNAGGTPPVAPSGAINAPSS